MKTVKEWLNEINIQKLIGYYQTMYPIYLDDTQLDETITIRRCRDMERSKLQDAIHQLQNLPITLPDNEIQYIIFSHKILIDSSDDETYAIVSVNELLDYCVGADTSGYDMYDPAEILSFLVADFYHLQNNNISSIILFRFIIHIYIPLTPPYYGHPHILCQLYLTQ